MFDCMPRACWMLVLDTEWQVKHNSVVSDRRVATCNSGLLGAASRWQWRTRRSATHSRWHGTPDTNSSLLSSPRRRLMECMQFTSDVVFVLSVCKRGCLPL